MEGRGSKRPDFNRQLNSSHSSQSSKQSGVRESKRPRRSETRTKQHSPRTTVKDVLEQATDSREEATEHTRFSGDAARRRRQSWTLDGLPPRTLQQTTPLPTPQSQETPTTSKDMDRSTRKGNEQKSTEHKNTSGNSADDIRSELRKIAESSGLQGILKSFGRVDELFGVGQSTGKRLKDIVENLNSQEMGKIRMATDDLNNLLNNTAEDAYSTFPIEQIMPALVHCMTFDDDFDVTLKAIRCLGTFARSLPSSCSSMVNHGAIPALCTRLLSIEVIDVAEESIRAIKYIAKEAPEACLTNGALCAVLSYLDFFSHHEQRDAVESAAHMCRGLKAENCASVIDQVPTLVNLLGYEDPILVEKAAQALLSICEASVTQPAVMQVLSETQLVGKSLELISGASVTPMKSSTFFGLIKILTLCAGNHTQIAELLLKNSISEVLLNIFSSQTSGWSPASSASIVKTPEQLSEILKLTNSLLPAPPSPVPPSPDAMDISTSPGSCLTDVFAEDPALISKFGADLLPVMLQVYSVTSSQPVRAQILLIWSNVVRIIDREPFQHIAKRVKISSLLGPLLLSTQDEIVLQAMSLVEALMEKLPTEFTRAFVDEGVLYAIARLASPNAECEVTPERVRRSPRLREIRQAEPSNSVQTSQRSDLSAERQEAMTRAHAFIQTHYHSFSPNQDTERVRRLKGMTEKLPISEQSQTALIELLRVMNEEGENLSTFEFIRSQVVQSLNGFLMPDLAEVLDKEEMEPILMPAKRLVRAGLSIATVSGSSPLQGLVHKLRDAVAACESLPVRRVIQRNIRNLGPSARTGSDEAKGQNIRLASLGQPLKLKLERHADEKELKELPQSQVLVEPLVVMQALEEYLWPRVRPSGDKPDKNTEQPSQQQSEMTEQSSSSRQTPGKSRSSVVRRSKHPMSKTSSTRPEASPDSESMSCSHDESEEGTGAYAEEDLFLDEEEEEEGLDDGMSDEDGFDEDDEEEIEGLSHVHSVTANSEDVDEMEDTAGPSSSSADPPTYAHRLIKSKGSEIEFCIGEVAIKPQATIFQAIRESIAMTVGYEEDLECKQERIASFRQKWEETHCITYRRRTNKPDKALDQSSKNAKSSHTCLLDKRDVTLSILKRATIPDELEIDEEMRQLLLLLKTLDTVNSIAHRLSNDKETVRPLSRSEFVSSKLATKLSQQIHDPLTMCSSSAPPWTTHLVISCKFLFPFELRRKFFYCKLGVPRALLYFNKEYEAAGERKETLKVERNDQEVRLSQLKSNRVRVSRSKIYSSAMKIMGMYAHNTNEILEVHYYNESGVGEGPTLEFYTLMSQELQKRSLNMWRDEPKSTDVGDGKESVVDDGSVHAPKGLFPRPYAPSNAPEAVLRSFVFMGKAVARSLIDGRLMDLNINPLFFRILRGEPVDSTDLHMIDPQLGSSIEKLQNAVDSSHGSRIEMDGVSLDDLYLPYSLPGYEDYPCKYEAEAAEFVNDSNIRAYIDQVVRATLCEGIEAQICAFKEGFESVLPVKMLEMFCDDELDLLLRGTQESWTVEELADCVNFSHGYSPLCDQARWFLEILSELDDEQRRSFLQFVTGSPRLPPGGIAALSPKLTVVQRLNSKEGSSENDLPSVATCVNFLKLPKYGSKEVMKERLVIAFNEGQYAFDLS